ncbi:MAG: hypothetical protein COA42_04795 [Alteromonadaceae bacterium]|nr:MAG: hypothetical protein COA42_04795 [Alteromonadaceae bacterium]
MTISLRLRFFIGISAVLILVLLASFWLVESRYRNDLYAAAHERLRLHVFTLLSVAQVDEDGLVMPDISYNPKLNTLNSGLWAMVLAADKSISWLSLSIERSVPGLVLSETPGQWHFSELVHTQTEGADQKQSPARFLVVAYKVAWDDGKTRRSYDFVVAENRLQLDDQLNRTRLRLAGVFTSIILVVIASLMLVLRLAFRPITTLEHEIAALENGQQARLVATYPQELRGVTANLNALIEKESQQRERYRAAMADLAHSLKTPMTIIRTELSNYRENSVLQSAIARVDDNIEYQLRRAVISQHTLVRNGTEISHVLSMVLEAMQKIYKHKQLSVDAKVDPELFFSGDENELMELLGNLLDNAHKHAQTQVNITVRAHKQRLEILIADDGAGIADDACNEIFKRGARLDSRDPGQGIGLAVVADIVAQYQGQIHASRSQLGGALFTLHFPNKRS